MFPIIIIYVINTNPSVPEGIFILSIDITERKHAEEELLESNAKLQKVLSGIISAINVPVEIISRPGSLSNIEREIIRVHPQAGYDILKKIDFSRPVAQIAQSHAMV